jgi:type IV secretion system protein VirB5
MKKHLTLCFVTSFLSIYPSFAGGIPVIDVSSIAQQIIQVEHMVRQIEQLQEQITLSHQELKNMSGVRGLGNIIDSAYDKSVHVNPNTVLQSQNIKTASQIGLTGELATLHNTQNTNSATALAQSQKSLEQSKERFNALSVLLNKVNDSPEQKDILDLQARISVEQAFLQNEMIKLSMLQSETEAKKAIQIQKIQQMRIESSGSLSDFSGVD